MVKAPMTVADAKRLLRAVIESVRELQNTSSTQYNFFFGVQLQQPKQELTSSMVLSYLDKLQRAISGFADDETVQFTLALPVFSPEEKALIEAIDRKIKASEALQQVPAIVKPE